MPYLNEWAKQAVNFRSAYSPGGWTTVAVGSLMRGIFPRRLAYTSYYETNRYRLFRTPDPAQLKKGERFAKMFPIP